MSPKKTLVLGTLLLVPVLAFLFLKVFGVNRFSLQTYFPVSTDSTLVEGKWRYDTLYRQVPDFQLISQTGSSFSQEDVQGKIYVANFFYAACQGNCKQVSTQLARVQDAFRLQPDVKILSFSLQPQQDSVSVLQKYAQSFRARPETWVFLTGKPEQMQQLIQNGFTFPAAAPDKDSSLVQLQKSLFLVDRQRHVRGIYDGTDAGEVDRLITELNVLLSEDKNSNGKKDEK
ncbi:SCO family protein [Rufibacter radiotolerans]|uniref:SCO family protein n=1 Tax=Rufibacter radiotolerans TaxID=1379910 RepID=UPI0006647561|nr:SCO family protein [Rufibacter radiotolerans]